MNDEIDDVENAIKCLNEIHDMATDLSHLTVKFGDTERQQFMKVLTAIEKKLSRIADTAKDALGD